MPRKLIEIAPLFWGREWGGIAGIFGLANRGEPARRRIYF